MPMLLYGNGMISGATSMPTNVQFGGNLSVTGYANVTQGLSTASRGIAADSVPTGSIVQVVNVAGLSTVAIATSSMTNIGSVSITPKFSTSKILILASTYVHRDGTGNVGFYWDCYIYRNSVSTQLSRLTDAVLYQSQGDGTRETVTSYYVDSPGTTSSTTYGMCASRINGTSSATFNNGNAGSIILMEIAA